jgi:iron-sulfur cluster assembly accessory protein
MNVTRLAAARRVGHASRIPRQRYYGATHRGQRMTSAAVLSSPSLTLSERAAKRIVAIAAADQAPDTALRITVEGGGCSGFQYKFDMVPLTTLADRIGDYVVVERNGARLVVDTMSVELMAGSEVDFVDDLLGSSFQIKNPNATASCGCGTSFSL